MITDLIFIRQHVYNSSCLVDSLRLAHGTLDVECPDILPVLLQQRHQEVDGQRNILVELLLRHLRVTHTGGKTQHLK